VLLNPSTLLRLDSSQTKRSRVSFVRSEDLWRRSSWRRIQGVQWANKKWPFVFVKERFLDI
jgi:hypothetical protein